MGEARRRAQKGGLAPRLSKTKKKKSEDSQRLVAWLPITDKQRTQFIEFTIRGGWVGIGILALLWITVRIIGPAAGWWVPADLH